MTHPLYISHSQHDRLEGMSSGKWREEIVGGAGVRGREPVSFAT